MVSADAVIAFSHNLHPWTTKSMDLETVSLSVTPNHRKLRKCCQSWSQEAPQIHPKLHRNSYLGLSVSIGCPPGPQDHQNGVQGTQKGPSRSLKSQFFIESDPFQQSTCHAGTSTAMGLRGRRQGANPLDMDGNVMLICIELCRIFPK